MRIMRQMLWSVHRSIVAHGMYSGLMPTPLTNPVPDSENSSAVSSLCSSPRDKNQPSEKHKQKPKQGDDSIRISPLIIESINSTILQQLIVIAATEIPSMPSAGEFDLSRENSTLMLPKEELLRPKIYNRFMFLGPGDYHITFLVDAERLKQDPTYIYAVTQLLYYAFGSAVYRQSSVPPASNVFLSLHHRQKKIPALTTSKSFVPTTLAMMLTLQRMVQMLQAILIILTNYTSRPNKRLLSSCNVSHWRGRRLRRSALRRFLVWKSCDMRREKLRTRKIGELMRQIKLWPTCD